MEKETNLGEQPIVEQMVQVAGANAEKEGTNCLDEGSHYGKFKDADTLLSAYNNLEAEFTRKCQRLSELEKQTGDNAEDVKTTSLAPLYEKENWHEIVQDFLTANEQAKPFSKEICDILMADEEMAKNDNALELAFAKVMKQKFLSPQEFEGNKERISKLAFSDDEIKKQVLDIYIKQIFEQNVPPIMSQTVGSQVAVSKPQKPGDMDEAKRLVNELFGL